MSRLLLGTTVVSPDEPCLGLYELHLQSPGNRGWRRYQIVLVMRGDHPAEARKDLGAAERFADVSQFRIPGGAHDETTGRFHVVHTVGELVDIADALREGPHRPEQQQAADLVGGYHREIDKRRSRRRGRVAFGWTGGGR